MQRKRIRVKYAAMMCVVALAAICGACSPASGAAKTEESAVKRFTIGFSNGFSGNSWRAMMLASLDQEVQKYPDIILSVVDGQNDTIKQVNDIQSLIAKNVDAIMVIPNSAQAIEPVLKEARGRGIKVCVFNLPVNDPESYDIYLGTDATAKGKKNGEFLVKKLGGKGKIIALGGIPGNSYTAAGLEGLKQALEGAEIEILTIRDCDWAEDKAKIVMTDILSVYQKIDGIWADGAQVSCGALKAMLDAKRPLIPVTGDDYNGLLKLYDQYKDKESNLDFNSISEPTWEAREALKLLYRLLKGEKVEKDTLIMPESINKDNYQNFLKKDMPDTLFVDNDLPPEVLANLFH
jgi:ribose transport system substrate-binding protein